MNNNASPKDFVANYELNSYRYSDFWRGREYEHQAEVTLLISLLKRFVPDLGKREIVDLGGAFGRLTSLYGEGAKSVILADYSTNELLEGQKNIANALYRDKVSFIALNAYRLPFAENSIDMLLSVRVVHHLKDLPLFFAELGRALVPGGIAVIEFANKNHILALLRRLVKFDVGSYARIPVLQVGHKNDSSQGMKEGQVSIMYNFSPVFVSDTAVNAGLVVEGMFACSFLRIGFLKKLLPLRVLNAIERILQKIMPKLLITPSVFAVIRKSGEFNEKAGSLQDRLRCPTCGSGFNEDSAAMVCVNGHAFEQKKVGIIDLRDPKPELVDF